jgi:hypothetical protein
LELEAFGLRVGLLPLPVISPIIPNVIKMNSEIQSIDLNQIKALGIQDKEKAINLYMKTTLEQFEQFRFETHNAQVKIRKNFYYFIPFSIITLISFVIYSNSVLSYIVLVLGLFAVFIKSYFLAISFDHKYNLQLFFRK